ncbi:type I restriction enzyme HsdR N-terminal domain-containing protein [Panacibacter sp. DH6]|uniref:Type I restriction enzyme HsdR N-terminal domain-containing protein n=1 Tax=Panacibacter microcysteis TaxID=2793269 RepID=A0A931E8D6_9BACT|nr:type I restriction enzyme HsdR N-terminal domain-containing protein [Panacibacter microcysteis]MBG9377165.1 type I restriction enzyme HsdR N-terminal domain-containing protein [Panacibacter microcysteis]
MLQVSYPFFNFRVKEEKGKQVIFDEVRKKWVRFTPEEWVRQNFIQFLLQVKKYPASIIAVEKEIRLGELRKRCDIVIYNKHVPWIIIECKEQDVLLSETVLQQSLRYNITLQAEIIVITNGTVSFGFQLKNGHAQALTELPSWS